MNINWVNMTHYMREEKKTYLLGSLMSALSSPRSFVVCCPSPLLTRKVVRCGLVAIVDWPSVKAKAAKQIFLLSYSKSEIIMWHCWLYNWVIQRSSTSHPTFWSYSKFSFWPSFLYILLMFLFYNDYDSMLPPQPQPLWRVTSGALVSFFTWSIYFLC